MVNELFRDGVLLRSEALALGYDDNALLRMRRAGQIVRIRQGAYADARHWSSLDPVGRHGLLTVAVVRQYDDDVATSHDTAVLDLGGPNYGLVLSDVHLTHLLARRPGRRNVAGIVHHEGRVSVLDVTRVDDHWVTSPARTVLDVALTRGVEAGVIVADDFLRRGMTSKHELWMLYACVAHWPGALILRLVVDRADGRSESVGETLGREFFRRHRLPMPIPQYKVFHPYGRLAARTDWAWPEYAAFGEFDGTAKYVSHRREGESVADAVLREKRREDLVRELTGFRGIRFVWQDWFAGERTAARIRDFLLRRAA
jgi:hypothetical protein